VGAQVETDRVFFALWPDPTVQARLHHVAQRLHGVCGGRATRAETIHVTLAFLGAVDSVQLDSLRAIAGTVVSPTFSWQIESAGWWSHNRIVWAAPAATPPELTLLVDQLHSGLLQAGFKIDPRPYAPHATLLRKADCRHTALSMEAIPWDVTEFVLVQSVITSVGAAYESMGRWPLVRG